MKHTLYATNTGLNAEAVFNASGFSGLGGNVYPRLHFQISLNVSKSIHWHRGEDIQAWSFGLLLGHLRIGNEIIADIKPFAVNSWLWGEQKEDQKNHPIKNELMLTIEIPLDSRRIEWLEKHRSGKSFEATLHINLQTQLFGRNTFTPSFTSGLMDVLRIDGDIPIIVPDTQWRERVLPGLGYGTIIAIELPAISPDGYKELNHSLKAFHKAQRQFESGFYDDTAASCRVAIDQFFESKDDGSGKMVPRLKQSWEMRLGAATSQWLETALGTIKVASNKPHHSADNHFNRLGAQMLLMVTTALVSYAAQYYSSKHEE